MATNTILPPPPSFRDLLYSLPQELFDRVYEQVFFDAKEQLVVIDKNYKPPSLLHVSRATRAEFAKSYYGNSVFVLDGQTSYKFIDELPLPHVKYIKCVHAVNSLQLRERCLGRNLKSGWQWAWLGWRALRLYCHRSGMWYALAQEGLAEKKENGISYAGARVAMRSNRMPRYCEKTLEDSISRRRDEAETNALFARHYL